MSKGYFVLMLHAHLPYVNHPDFPEFMEEKWLFEAISETYLPLLRVFRKLKQDNIPYKITMSITPPLMEMLSNRDLKRKYLSHISKLIELSEKEVKRTADEHPKKHKMAKFYLEDFKALKELYESINGDIVSAFMEFQRDGNLEIITCNATHGFLPLMARYPEAVNAQIKLGVDTYRKHTGTQPKGIWLAECGYMPGVDEHLKRNNLSFFFVDSHALWFSEPTARYGVYRPVITPSGVFVFARDPESSQQVWSAEIGYPGDSRYREFYRDVGFDREDWYVAPYVDPSGERHNTGIKYHKITSKDVGLNQKDYYDIDEAFNATKEHAHDFATKKRDQIQRLYEAFDGVEPVVVAPFDAELFGHWWFEGPKFIEEFFRAIAGIKEITPATPTEVIGHIKTIQEVTPAASTWGANGYNEVWLNGKNDWIYRHLDEMIEKMIFLAREYYNEKDSLKIRALNQMARELLLAQSSDWAFIMTTGTTVEYAVNRTKTHIKRFNDLLNRLKNNTLDPNELETLEWIDGIFKDIDYRIYAG
ncbi:glycoside hydrolase [Kosmotoga arenicorallina S304]|uniref:Glycoside hydrolase n=1 Tax=Kosmotoga arenicorallina S304 TaxID=1453497 RepID=A0A176K0R3_9BACT|nr:1,4-alpha-glucan branching protein domain-containing protein [Kosmotoga arenicorallina]OAA30418.1 glycoside hydrolase [Kosmotoga arenicorallina S304]